METTENKSATKKLGGTISIFGYSGFVIVEDGHRLEPIEFNDSGFLFHFMGPVRVAEPTWRPIPQFTNKSFKKLFPNAPDNLTGFRSVSLPSIGRDGEHYLKAIWSDDRNNDVKDYRDTFVVVILGQGSEDSGTKLAHSHLHRLIDWLRVYTRQWWLGKSSESVSGNLHLQLEMSESHKIQGHPIMRSNVASSHDGTKLLSTEMWKMAMTNVAKKLEAPLADLMFLDGLHSLHSGDLRQGILQLVSSIEVARNRALPACKGTDLLRHLTVDFEKVYGRRLDNSEPNLYMFLKAIWICRGHTAHGKDPLWITDSGTVPVESIETRYLVENVDAIMRWIEDIAPISG